MNYIYTFQENLDGGISKIIFLCHNAASTFGTNNLVNFHLLRFLICQFDFFLNNSLTYSISLMGRLI